jgi:hypothetical protein
MVDAVKEINHPLGRFLKLTVTPTARASRRRAKKNAHLK